MRYARWYEFDGLIVSKGDRQKMVKRMWTMTDGTWSDHRSVCVCVNVKNRRFRRGVHDCEQRVPRIRWGG